MAGLLARHETRRMGASELFQTALIDLQRNIMNKTALLSAWILGAALIQPAVAAETAAPPATVAEVDVPRYMGRWHEIARLPMRFQNDCVRDVTADYRLNENRSVTVLNRCRKADGEMIEATGLAKAADAGGSKLKVTFLPKGLRWLPFGKASYWILRLDASYQTALVGTPDRKYLWLLSRTPDIDEAVYQRYLDTAREQGYDLDGLIRNPN